LITRLHKELELDGHNVPAHVLYEAPTVSALARFINQDQQQDAALIAERQTRGQKRRERLKGRGQSRAGRGIKNHDA
jgi:hypothetical protein